MNTKMNKQTENAYYRKNTKQELKAMGYAVLAIIIVIFVSFLLINTCK